MNENPQTEPAAPGKSVLSLVSASPWLRPLLLGAILLLSLLLRLYHVNYPPTDYHCWRQTQTLMVAKCFHEWDMNPLHPRVYWRNTVSEPMETEGLVGGTELQVTPWLTALLYKVFGTAHWVDRVVPISFSLLGLVFFFLLVERFSGLAGASAATLLLSLSPMYLFFGRVQMPEPFSLAMGFATLLTFDSWLRRRSTPAFLLALFCCALMLLGKPTMAFIAVPMFFLVLLHLGRRFLLEWRLYLFAAIVAGVFLLFNWYSFKVLAPISQLMFYATGLSNMQPLLSAAFYEKLGESIWMRAVGWPLCLLALPTLLWPGSLRALLPHAWALGFVLITAAVAGGAEDNDYYQLALAPAAAFLAGQGIQRFLWRKYLHVVALALIAAAGYISVTLAAPMYADPVGEDHYRCGEWVRTHTEPDARVLSASPNPAALYFASRLGWTSWYEMQGNIEFNRETVARTKELGASVIMVPDGATLDDAHHARYRDTRDYLYENFWSHRGDDFAVFLLDLPPDLRPPADGRIDFGTFPSRKYLRGLWGPNYYAEVQQATFTEMRASSASIQLDLPPGIGSFTLRVSSPVNDNAVIIKFDGKTVGDLRLPKRWAQGDAEVYLHPLQTLPGKHTITLETTSKHDGASKLLLFHLQLHPFK